MIIPLIPNIVNPSSTPMPNTIHQSLLLRKLNPILASFPAAMLSLPTSLHPCARSLVAPCPRFYTDVSCPRPDSTVYEDV